MAVPKRRISRAQRGNKRAHQKLARLQLVRCSNEKCNSMIVPHTICPDCGQYRGRQVFAVAGDER